MTHQFSSMIYQHLNQGSKYFELLNQLKLAGTIPQAFPPHLQILNLQKAAIERRKEEERQLKQSEAEWLVQMIISCALV